MRCRASRLVTQDGIQTVDTIPRTHGSDQLTGRRIACAPDLLPEPNVRPHPSPKTERELISLTWRLLQVFLNAVCRSTGVLVRDGFDDAEW